MAAYNSAFEGNIIYIIFILAATVFNITIFLYINNISQYHCIFGQKNNHNK